MIFARQAEIPRAQLDNAVAKGARIPTGGRIIDHESGLWCEPTVLADVTQDMAVMRDETFGPIVPIMSFDTVDEAVQLANDTEFGLPAAIISDEDAAIAVGQRINAGGMWINDFDTMGGVGARAEKTAFGSSGLGGSRYGHGGFLRFLCKKAIVARRGGVTERGASGRTRQPSAHPLDWRPGITASLEAHPRHVILPSGNQHRDSSRYQGAVPRRPCRAGQHDTHGLRDHRPKPRQPSAPDRQSLEHRLHPCRSAPDEGTGCWKLISISDEIYMIVTDCDYVSTRFEKVPSEGLVEFHFLLEGPVELAMPRPEEPGLTASTIMACHQAPGVSYDVCCLPGRFRMISLYVRPELLADSFGFGAQPGSPAAGPSG